MGWRQACGILPGMVALFAAAAVLGQSPSGPITPPPGTPVEQTPQTKISTRVALVNTPVTVRNSKGEMVDNLEAKDFHITDNGVAQNVLHFDMGSDPLSLVILVEISSRIEPVLPEIRKTGIIFTDTVMGPDGEAAVVGFNDSVDKLADFTRDHEVIQSTINKLKAGMEGSKLFDAMAVGVEMLSGRPQPQPTADSPGRRRVMVIVSEATDVGSETRLGAVLRQAQLANITIYSVGISTTAAELKAQSKDVTHKSQPDGTFPVPGPPGSVQTPTTEQNREGYGNIVSLIKWAVTNVKNKVTDHALEIATAGTGGAHIATFKDKSIEKAVDEIGGELHSQYSLTYAPAGTSQTGYHEIQVQVDKKDLKVRARPGYYLAPPGS
jgi:VWFA-related protein